MGLFAALLAVDRSSTWTSACLLNTDPFNVRPGNHCWWAVSARLFLETACSFPMLWTSAPSLWQAGQGSSSSPSTCCLRVGRITGGPCVVPVDRP